MKACRLPLPTRQVVTRDWPRPSPKPVTIGSRWEPHSSLPAVPPARQLQRPAAVHHGQWWLPERRGAGHPLHGTQARQPRGGCLYSRRPLSRGQRTALRCPASGRGPWAPRDRERRTASAPGRDRSNPACPPCALTNGHERSTAVNLGICHPSPGLSIRLRPALPSPVDRASQARSERTVRTSDALTGSGGSPGPPRRRGARPQAVSRSP